MRRQLVPGPVVRLTVIKAKTRPGIEASMYSPSLSISSPIIMQLQTCFQCTAGWPPDQLPVLQDSRESVPSLTVNVGDLKKQKRSTSGASVFTTMHTSRPSNYSTPSRLLNKQGKRNENNMHSTWNDYHIYVIKRPGVYLLATSV